MDSVEDEEDFEEPLLDELEVEEDLDELLTDTEVEE
jgi:hypothetical protein